MRLRHRSGKRASTRSSRPGVDEQQHLHGPWSAQARSAIEEADRQLARLIEACRRSGVWDETALFVVSDHGFATAHTEVRLAAILAERGLISRGRDGRPTGWRAAVQSNGGSACIYTRRSARSGGGRRGARRAGGRPGPTRRPTTSIGQHGYPPDRESMQASFLAYGPGVRAVELGQVRLLDLAPTVAAWLRVSLARASGRPIDLFSAEATVAILLAP